MSTLDFGGRIKTLRLSKSMTQEQLAQRLRVSPQAVSKWENGVTLPDIQLLPEYDKAAHTALFEAEGGVFPDWNDVNHHRTIAFYQDFIARHPSQRRAYLWLLDLLIDDGRCPEARKYLEKMNRLGESYHSDLYLGMILEKEGKLEEAAACWERMTQKDPDNWQSWFARADRLAKRCAYPEAIALYEKALALSPRPRFTDPVNAIAQLYEIQGQYEKAVEFYQKEIEIVRQDWNETQGEAIDEPLRNIARLKEKMIE